MWADFKAKWYYRVYRKPKPFCFQAAIGFKSDVWALGIILYQWMYDGLVPYSELPGK